jgi:hypothetical protein
LLNVKNYPFWAKRVTDIIEETGDGLHKWYRFGTPNHAFRKKVLTEPWVMREG